MASKTKAAKELSWAELTRLYFRRSFSYSNVYFVLSFVIEFALLGVLSVVHGGSELASTSTAIGTRERFLGINNESALLLSTSYLAIEPLFGLIGSMPSMAIFVSDRDKGVLEYLIAYGFDPSSVFAAVCVSSMALSTIVIAPPLAVASYLVFRLVGYVPRIFVDNLVLYALPMSYAVVALTAVVSMTWSSMSRSRPGVNSPIGLAPVIGLLPVLAAEYSQFLLPAYLLPYVGIVITAIVVAALLVTFALAIGKLARERFLPTG